MSYLRNICQKKKSKKKKKKVLPTQSSPNNLEGEGFYFGIQLVLFLSYVIYIFQIIHFKKVVKFRNA